MTPSPQSSISNTPPSLHPYIGNFTQWWRPALALLIVALVYFYRIDQPLLWDDEADTGIVARNILRHGYPTAYDGRNVVIYDGRQLNGNLVSSRIPWTQFYLGALSLLIFGNTTSGLRILFVFCGVLSFFPIYAVLKSRLKYPSILALLILIAPQVVVFQRNARYYPILILLYAVLVWHFTKNFKSSRSHFISALLIFVLLFHTHPFAAACSAFSLIVFCLFFRRKVLASYFFACVAGFASWFVWHQLLGPPIVEPAMAISLLHSDFSLWRKTFCAGLKATIVDMDAVGCIPILLWTALLAILLLRNRNALRNLLREPVFAFVILNILVQTLVGAAMFGSETSNQYALLRYTPHLLAFGLLACFMVLNAAIANKYLYLSISLLAVVFNLLTVSFWTKPLSRHVPASWFFPVYSEIFRPRENARALIVSRLESEEQKIPGRDIVMVSVPYWTQNIATFYVGDRYLIHPMWDETETANACEQALRKNLNEQEYDRLFSQPEWILDYLGILQEGPRGYELAEVIPSHQTRPDEAGRPELTRHAFPQSDVVWKVRLFHLRKN